MPKPNARDTFPQATSALRIQLVRRGYKIMPNRGKIPAIGHGWNEPEFFERELHDGPRGTMEQQVASWERRFPDATSTGLLIRDGLVMIDFDIDDEAVVGAMIGHLGRIAPEVAARGPTRFGNGYKVAIVARLAPGEEPFRRIGSQKFNGHHVEVFGGALGEHGKTMRQFGILGPHSFNDDGSVAVEYAWDTDYPALHETDPADLPAITKTQAHALVDAFRAEAAKAGWETAPEAENSTASAVYDITAETRFDTDRGGHGLTYDELCDEFNSYGELRCSSNFLKGRGDSGKRDRCWVSDQNRHQRVGVFVYGDEQMHYPVELAALSDDVPANVKMGPDVAAAISAVSPVLREPSWRERYANWDPKPSFHNTRLAIEALGIKCSEDVFHNELYIGRNSSISPNAPNWPFAGLVTDPGIGALRTLISTTWGLDFGERNVRDVVNALCHENQFNPVVEMLAEAEASWDGVARLDRMAVEHFNAPDTELNRICVRKTMIAAVARARQPGIKFDTILVMESPEGLNKSSAWAVLAGEGNFSDESILGKASREVQEHLAGVWIHENAELAGITKGEVETIKAFASRQVDRARPAFGHFLVKQPRHSIEVGTTNDRKYLLSPSGNRRFWPIEVRGSIDLGKLRAARLQLWGEAAHYQSQGEALTLPEALWTVAGVEQEERRVRHPWEAKLAALTVRVTDSPVGNFGHQGPELIYVVRDEERVTSNDLFRYLNIPVGQMHMGHSKTLASIMRLLGWSDKPFLLDGSTVRGYVRTKLLVITE